MDFQFEVIELGVAEFLLQLWLEPVPFEADIAEVARALASQLDVFGCEATRLMGPKPTPN